MAIQYKSGRRASGTNAERLALTTAAKDNYPSGLRWSLLGRTTLGADTDDITVSSLANKKYLMILGHGIMNGNVDGLIRFNGDIGNNYASSWSDNGSADFTQVLQPKALWCPDSNSTDRFGIAYIVNESSKEKLFIGSAVGRNTAGNEPNRRETVCKWANTTNTISSITFRNNQNGSFTSGSELVVLGADPNDSATTSEIWEELASVDLSGGASTSLSTDTFTAKKYLYVEGYIDSSAGATDRKLVCGNNTVDLGGNYARRRSDNGGADTTSTSSSRIMSLSDTNTTLNGFFNCFIINKADKEKLCIGEYINQNTAGAGTAPQRAEAVGKWNDMTNQINILEVRCDANMGVKTSIKVWGFD